MEPPATRWSFPPADTADENEVVGLGADLAPGTLLSGYRSGLFPMPLDGAGQLGWFSPDPRGVLEIERLKVSRSLRQSCRRYEIRVNTSFEQVMRSCGDPKRPHGWINEEFLQAYCRLHELGWAHSIETWSREGELVGGLYGVSIGGLFAGESMFHNAVDASKVALVALVDRLAEHEEVLLDVQWATEHLLTLGVIEIDRLRYLKRLTEVIEAPYIPF